MKHLALLISATIAFTAQGTYIPPASRLRLSQIYETSHPGTTRNDDEHKYEPMILELADETVAEHLTEAGVIVYAHRNCLYLTSVPREMIHGITDLEGVKSVASAAFEVNSCMDRARPFANVEAVQAGDSGLPVGYDGTDVVVGFSDIGFDATHVAFGDRVGAIYHIDAFDGTIKSATNDAEISAWTTDNVDAYHATHVANILAGGYRGNEYYGVATGAEIVATTSGLDYVSILTGVEKVIDYAKQRQKPAVINLSLSDQMGPRDGTDLICQYLSYCAKDAIICISAGNTGHINVYACRDLSEGDAEISLVSYSSADVTKISGYVDIWADSDEAFEYRVGLYDGDMKTVVYTSPWIVTGDSLSIKAIDDDMFAQYTEGEIRGYSEVSPHNGRNNVTIGFNMKCHEESSKAHRARYFGYVATRRHAESQRDVHVDIFRGSSTIEFYFVKGNDTHIGNDASINNMCCADGVVSVGMATSRNTAPSLTEEIQSWKVTENAVTPYSSYNIVESIKPLPHFSAPGCYVMSALSGIYLDNHPEFYEEVGAVSQVDDKKYYWFPECGTSMSAPLAAGIIALWLQADNSLISEQVIDIATMTARTDFDDIDDPRWGAGCIDAVTGMKMVLENANKIDIKDEVSVTVTPDRRLKFNGISPDNIKVYGLDGIEVDPTRQLDSGVYVVALRGGQPQKIWVR